MPKIKNYILLKNREHYMTLFQKVSNREYKYLNKHPRSYSKAVEIAWLINVLNKASSE